MLSAFGPLVGQGLPQDTRPKENEEDNPAYKSGSGFQFPMAIPGGLQEEEQQDDPQHHYNPAKPAALSQAAHIICPLFHPLPPFYALGGVNPEGRKLQLPPPGRVLLSTVAEVAVHSGEKPIQSRGDRSGPLDHTVDAGVILLAVRANGKADAAAGGELLPVGVAKGGIVMPCLVPGIIPDAPYLVVGIILEAQRLGWAGFGAPFAYLAEL